MPPRPLRRRGGSQRWLLIPFVLTMLVLLVDASMHARSSGPETTMDNQAWVDTVLPYIAESTVQGREIAQISSDRLADGSRSCGRSIVVDRHGRGFNVHRGDVRHPAGAVSPPLPGSWTPVSCPGTMGPPRWPPPFRTCSEGGEPRRR